MSCPRRQDSIKTMNRRYNELGLNNLNVEAKAAKDTINILEDKVSKSEAAALKVFKERILETDKALEYHELEMSRNLLRDKLDKATDHENNIKAKLQE